jgi:hypothetical protein
MTVVDRHLPSKAIEPWVCCHFLPLCTRLAFQQTSWDQALVPKISSPNLYLLVPQLVRALSCPRAAEKCRPLSRQEHENSYVHVTRWIGEELHPKRLVKASYYIASPMSRLNVRSKAARSFDETRFTLPDLLFRVGLI